MKLKSVFAILALLPALACADDWEGLILSDNFNFAQVISAQSMKTNDNGRTVDFLTVIVAPNDDWDFSVINASYDCKTKKLVFKNNKVYRDFQLLGEIKKPTVIKSDFDDNVKKLDDRVCKILVHKSFYSLDQDAVQVAESLYLQMKNIKDAYAQALPLEARKFVLEEEFKQYSAYAELQKVIKRHTVASPEFSGAVYQTRLQIPRSKLQDYDDLVYCIIETFKLNRYIQDIDQRHFYGAFFTPLRSLKDEKKN